MNLFSSSPKAYIPSPTTEWLKKKIVHASTSFFYFLSFKLHLSKLDLPLKFLCVVFALWIFPNKNVLSQKPLA